MVELKFLGTGGSVATEGRDNTSFLILFEQELILVDCPGSVIPKIKKLHHPDHIYGLPSFSLSSAHPFVRPGALQPASRSKMSCSLPFLWGGGL